MEHFYSRKWSFFDYLRFVMPSVFSMFLISLYQIVDAFFIARYAGPLAMAAVNIILPFFCFTFGMGVMLAAGSSAIIGIELGKGQPRKALAHFSLMSGVLCLLMVMIIGLTVWWGTDTLARLLGATDALLPYCVGYLNTFIVGLGGLVLQVAVEYFMRLDGRPGGAFLTSCGAGLTNIVLDYVFIVRMGMGIEGAGIASTAGVLVAIGMGVVYFLFKSKRLRFVKPRLDVRFLLGAMVNGSSEMVSEMSAGVKTLVFNYMVLRYAGEFGVAALSIMMFIYYLLSSVHIGLSVGVAPAISFNYGKRNFQKIRQLVRTSGMTMAFASIVTFGVAIVYGGDIIAIFAKGEQDVITIGEGGMNIFAFSFLLEGVSILASGFFTAVNNGKISALISFLKSFVFTLGFVMLLPPFLGLQGIWLSVPMSEVAAVGMSVFFYLRYRRQYVCPDSSKNG
ncbi:MATE family efflux transporter [Pseudodesulfovibrio sp. JC047]|uniref:MATE family efflux transporter n=1 Tax=Pseudodesulfovibrio sp. JC047 TaxID=2683199 RepID=UPI0013D042C0|nr:MATE family efflux transporter [Pseudodesulfovibrio sp. JC047]NDV20495.1 MATE family efflux transporter [Pseudodesulfovibrio sp. JC047]